MRPVEIADEDRAAYHAAASIASNFLITLEAAAERLGASAGARARAARAAGARDGRELGAARPRARADRAGGARRRGHRRPPARRASPRPRPSCCRCSTRWCSATRGARGRRRAGGPAGMNVIRTVAELRAALREPRRAGRTIGLVPDDGRLPRGPPVADAPRPPGLRRGRRVAVRQPDPVQRPGRPRRATRATTSATPALAAELGVDYLFAPAGRGGLPAGLRDHRVGRAGSPRRSRARTAAAAHFDGVTTVVTKLFNMVGPDVAYFGQKDAQQALVIQPARARPRHARSRIEVCPTVREPDGLAMSSRNVHLSPAERARATALHRALARRAGRGRAGERDPGAAARPARSPSWPARRSSPSTSSSSSADTLAPREPDRRRRRSPSSPPASATPD